MMIVRRLSIDVGAHRLDDCGHSQPTMSIPIGMGIVMMMLDVHDDDGENEL